MALPAFLAVLFLTSCGPSVKLTDELVVKYIAGYKKIRAASPELAGAI
ncbi:MAG: hypothetical protein JNM63_16275, partial [Spirochaetia bacterium]|nr:hypothetical protein [Spirochaetia bacterium]